MPMKAIGVYPRWSLDLKLAFEFEKLEVALARLWLCEKGQKEAV